MRLLLVEDDKKLNQSLAFQLEKEGFQVDACMDGEEALYYVEQDIHDLILLDRMLPRVSGMEVLRRIRCITRRPRKMAFGEAVSCGDLSYDVSENRLNGPQGNCSLSRREGMLLETFLRNPSQTLSRPQLLTKVWGPDSDVEDGNLDNYIHFLRRRLQAVGSSLKIQTVRGVGYRLQQP